MDIICDRLAKAYDGRAVLRSLSCRFREGTVSCLTGPSGCGKTTLLRLLLGLTAPDRGTVTGVPAGPAAAVFQEDRLVMHLSALENLRCVLPRARRGDPGPARMLEGVLLDPADRRPVREYSGGMQRRVALARALACDASFAVMDEPFKGLDEATRLETIRFVRERLQGRTAVIVTHDPGEAALLGAVLMDLPGMDAG